MTAAAARPGMLGESVILNYSWMYMPLSMALLPVGVWVIPMYAEMGVSMVALGSVLLLARISDVFTDPLIGVLSDRTKTRLGRRKPWLAAGTPLMMISVYMLFMPPDQPTSFYFLVWIVMIYLAFTIIDLPYFAWGAELSPDYNERSKVTGRREQLHFAGTVTANVIPLILIFWISWEGIGNQQFDSLWQTIGALVSFESRETLSPRPVVEVLGAVVLVLMPLTVLVAVLFVPNGINREIPRRKPSFAETLRVVRRNGPFMRLVFCFLVSVLGASMTSALSFFFVKHVILAGKWYALYLLVYYLSSVVGLPVWTRLATRIGKHRALQVAILWFAFWASFIPFIPAGWFPAFLFIMCMKGSSIGALLAIPASMAADAIDIDTARTGKERAGLYFSVWSMLKKGSGALGGFLALTLVGFFGFDPTADPELGRTPEGNSSGSLLALTLLYSIIPALFKFLALPFLFKYPLTEERQVRIRGILERRKAALEAAGRPAGVMPDAQAVPRPAE